MTMAEGLWRKTWGGRLGHDDEPLHAGDRRQEPLVLELAALAGLETLRHPLRRGARQAQAARLEGRNPAPFAVRKGARAQDENRRGVGEPRHFGISRRTPSRA